MRPLQASLFLGGPRWFLCSLKPSECSKARDTNRTPIEQYGENCESDPNGPGCENGHPCEPCGSPLVLDLASDGFAFVGAEGGVEFDIDGDMRIERSGWTTRSRDPDAFLCLDRNGNRVIDSGRELFGDATLFLNGFEAENGYQTLFELEIEFGDGDGFVEPDDAIYHRLRVWKDRNKNGTSEPSEIHSLSQVNVIWIDTHYTVGMEVDEHGNWLRFVSHAAVREADGSIRVIDTTDVFFDLQD